MAGSFDGALTVKELSRLLADALLETKKRLDDELGEDNYTLKLESGPFGPTFVIDHKEERAC